MSVAPMLAPVVSTAVYSREMVHVPAEVDRSLHQLTRLSPIELAFKDYFVIRMHFFFDATEWLKTDASRRPQDFMDTQRLKAALARVLASYPVLAAKFQAAASANEQPTLVGCDGGAQFESGSAVKNMGELPLSPEDYTSLTNSPSTPLEATIHALLPPFNFGKPLEQPPLMIRHTRFACGSVCLGVHMHHYLGDAEAYFNFVRDLGECYRQDSPAPLACEPHLDRSWLSVSAEELAASAALAKKSSGSGFELLHEDPAQRAVRSNAPTIASQTRLLRFTTDELKRMKEAATTEKGWVSTFEALGAHLARCVYAARNPDAASAPGSMLFVAPTNIRQRLGVSTPSKSFCNAVLPTLVRYDAQMLHPDTSLAAPAALAHDTLRASTPESWRATMAWLASQPRKDLITGEVHEVMHRSMVLSAWNKFGSHHTEFESGNRVVRICPSFGSSIEGLCLVNDNEVSPGGEGSVDAFIAIDAESMKRLQALPELHKFA